MDAEICILCERNKANAKPPYEDCCDECAKLERDKE